MKLHHFRGSRSSRPLWLVKELKAPVEIVPVNMFEGGHKSPDYLKLNPHARVPTFEDTETGAVLIESGAICARLLEKFDSERKLQPPPNSTESAMFQQWCYYAASTLDAITIDIYIQTNFVPPDQQDQAKMAAAKEQFTTVSAPLLERALEGNEYLCGAFSAADVVLGYCVHWAGELGWLRPGSELQRYVERLRARPAFAEAFE